MNLLKLFILGLSMLGTFMIFLYFSIKLRMKQKLYDSFFSDFTNDSNHFYDRIKKFSIFAQVDRTIKISKKNITITKFVIITLACALLGGIIGYALSRYILLGIAAAIVASFLPYSRLNSKVQARRKEIAAQFSQMLKHLGNYLRAGNNLRQAIEKTTLIIDGALGEVLGDIVQRINSGQSVSKAIDSAYEEISLVEFKMFDILINIHNDMGGDLAKSLDNLAEVINEKKVLRSEIDSLTQETKVSSYITAVIPGVLYLAMRFMAPEYVKQLEEISWGRIGLLASFIFIFVGMIIVRKISDVKVDKVYK